MDRLRSVFTWIFAIGFITLMFPVTCLIWFVFYPIDTDRRMVHRWLLFQGWFMTRTSPVWSFRMEGREKIRSDQTYIIISNHQSVLDIILLNNLRCDFRWVSKAENYKVPILGASMRMASYILIERGNKESVMKMMDEAMSSLKKGISIMMFPEGTRSKTSSLLPFKTGAFQLAMKADLPVLPVVVEGTGKVLPKHGYSFSSGHRLRLRVLDPVFPGSFGTGDAEELALRFREMIAAELEVMRQEDKA
ncbi:MAG: 1-acylglycerol-3-phosphate O-acyltransferase [Bacteroidales bacterium]|nr:1-acylglycerol-3-phosphate O-acyltransferase [Bacteroidales bacterium]